MTDTSTGLRALVLEALRAGQRPGAAALVYADECGEAGDEARMAFWRAVGEGKVWPYQLSGKRWLWMRMNLRPDGSISPFRLPGRVFVNLPNKIRHRYHSPIGLYKQFTSLSRAMLTLEAAWVAEAAFTGEG